MSKRATKPIDPLDGPIDFDRFGPARRNAFAGAGQRGGPSLLALWEMPQLGASAVLRRRGHPGRGVSRPTIARSVRLPAAVWKRVEDQAEASHLNVHQAMQAALLAWLNPSPPGVTGSRPAGVQARATARRRASRAG